MLNKLYKWIEKEAKIIFIIYILIFVAVIVLKFPTSLVTDTVKSRMAGQGITRATPQLMPFETITYYVSQVHSLTDWFIKNLAVNILLFIPFVSFFPVLTKKKRYMAIRVILAGCIFSAVVEIFQYIFEIGLCDIDDVILNAAGTAVGYGLYVIFARCAK